MTATELRQYDDLEVVSGPEGESDAVTLFVIQRNERYFLPAFLRHYRDLGVERFVVLDDRSIDGSSELLRAERDVTVVKSRHRYGDVKPVANGKERRMLHIWRTLLPRAFAPNRWAVTVDADEFLRLPDGVTFDGLFASLSNAPFDVVFATMLDVYPPDFAELMRRREHAAIDTSAEWYFDAERHLSLRRGERPRTLHPGAKARLYYSYGLAERMAELGVRRRERTWVHRVWRRYVQQRLPYYNATFKPALVRWRPEIAYSSSHDVNLEASTRHLLALVHYRFAGSIYDKVGVALREKNYASGSRDKKLLAELLQRMEETDGSFRYARSERVAGHAAFERTGNAFGIEARAERSAVSASTD